MLLLSLTLAIALSLSAVAAYYSIIGLTTIFAASVIPIIIMASVLEAGKLVTTVWLHENWHRAKMTMKVYLVLAVVVLMLITSMGIFGFLSRAHIEQTSANEETLAQIERTVNEIARQEQIISRAETKITQLESSGSGADANIQAQIDKEQERIDRAFDRIAPAIAQQNQTIADARAQDALRTKPYEVQLERLNEELSTLSDQADEYEQRISTLAPDSSASDALLAQAAELEETIVVTTNKLQSTERAKIQEGQAVIGVTSDGLFGSNTRRALETWVNAQRIRIADLQAQAAQLQADNQQTVVAERNRLTALVEQLRGEKTDEIRTRQREVLETIDNVRATESPVIQTARDEIQRLRTSAEDQVANSQQLIERLRQQLAQADKAAEIDAGVDEQTNRIRTAQQELEVLIDEKFTLESENRMQEAEVGPIKYIAELIYGPDANKNTLEEAVRWVIILLVFVFDPLAIVLLLAFTQNLAWRRQDKPKPKTDWEEYERARAQAIANNPGFTVEQPAPPAEEKPEDEPEEEPKVAFEDVDQETLDSEFENEAAEAAALLVHEVAFEDVDQETLDTEFEETDAEPEKTDADFEEEFDEEYEYERDGNVLKQAKKLWKSDNPDKTLKEARRQYNNNQINELPWVEYLDDPRVERPLQLARSFPDEALRGDIVLRIDVVPTELYKFNGAKWIEVSKNSTDVYSHSDEYINYLIEKISSGEYDPELLTDSERQEIELRLQKDI